MAALLFVQHFTKLTLVKTLIILSLSRSISTSFMFTSALLSYFVAFHNGEIVNSTTTKTTKSFYFLFSNSYICQYRLKTIITLNNLMISCERCAHRFSFIRRTWKLGKKKTTTNSTTHTQNCACSSSLQCMIRNWWASQMWTEHSMMSRRFSYLIQSTLDSRRIAEALCNYMNEQTVIRFVSSVGRSIASTI